MAKDYELTLVFKAKGFRENDIDTLACYLAYRIPKQYGVDFNEMSIRPIDE